MEELKKKIDVDAMANNKRLSEIEDKFKS